MKKYTRSPLLPIAMVGALTACQPNVEQQASEAPATEEPAKVMTVSYPVTAKGDVVDTYFSTEVADPYRWLEDDMSAETGAWVTAQNEVTQGYLSQIPYRDKIADKLRTVLNYERVSAPITRGDYKYFYKNDGLQNQSVVYRQKDGSKPELFLDPNKLSDDGTVSLAGMEFSEDGSLVAYMTSTGGSDWRGQ